MDILVRINKRLGNHESSKGIIYLELQRLNQTSIQLLHEILMKKSIEITKKLQEIGGNILNDND